MVELFGRKAEDVTWRIEMSDEVDLLLGGGNSVKEGTETRWD